MEFVLVQDAPYGDERWIEMRPPDNAVALVLNQTSNGPEDRSRVPDELPTSNVTFNCDDQMRTNRELLARGVRFPQPPVEQPFGWWSMFENGEGNRHPAVGAPEVPARRVRE
jgi:lactoylglutathione lyase